MQFDHPSYARTPGPSPRDSYLPVTGNMMQKVQKKWIRSSRGGWKGIAGEDDPAEPEKETAKAPKSSLKKPSYGKKKNLNRRATFEPKTYKRWEFGRDKSFVKPLANKKTNKAATMIQKLMRGWWQRLHFRVMMLQHLLETRAERTVESVERVQERTEKRKETVKTKLEKAHKRELEKVTKEETTANEGQKVIAYLRKENKKLREKNNKIYTAICALKLNNERLEEVNSKTDNSFSTLNDHAKQIEETHEKLAVVVPKYEESVATMKEAVELRRQFCLAEHKIKLLYTKCVGSIVEMVEDSSKDKTLVDEVVGYCLQMEGEDNPAKLPPTLDEMLENDFEDQTVSSDDSDDYDEYTVASLE